MHGLYLLWWVGEKQMSPATVAMVLAAGDLALLVLELPTGWFADRYGHRASLILGSLTQVAGMLLCWLGEGVYGLVLASVLIALGDAFRSGASEALLYNTCVALGREHHFQRIQARAQASVLAALVLLVLAGGVLVSTLGFAAGWLAETTLCAVGFAIACAMIEPRVAGQHHNAELSPNYSRPVVYRRLAMFIVPVALLGGAASAASFLAQTTEVVSAASVTLLVAAITTAEAAGSALASRLPPAKAADQLTYAVLGCAMLAAALLFEAALPLIAIGLNFLVGVAEPLRTAAVQRLVDDGFRARAASAASACDMAVSMLALPLAGIWRSQRRRK